LDLIAIGTLTEIISTRFLQKSAAIIGFHKMLIKFDDKFQDICFMGSHLMESSITWQLNFSWKEKEIQTC